MANRSAGYNAAKFSVFALLIVALAASADAQLTFNWSWNATGYTLAQFNQYLSGKTFTVNIGAPIFECTNVQFKMNSCSVGSIALTLAGNCVYNAQTGTALATFAAVPIQSTSISTNVVCDFQSFQLSVRRCQDVTCTSPGTGSQYSNVTFFSGITVIAQPFSINSIARMPTLIGAANPLFVIAAGSTSFPTNTQYIKVTVSAVSISGGPCNYPLGPFSWGPSGSANVRFYLPMNTQNDGCRIILSGMTIGGVNVTGSGTIPGNNIFADYMGGNMVVTASSSTVFRIVQTVTINGNFLPRGPEEGTTVTLATSPAGTCSSPVLPCSIQTYGSTSLTCTVDASVINGDDAINGGCPLTATITRLQTTLSNTATGMKCPNMLPPVAPLSGNPLSLKHSSTATSFTVASLNQAIGGKVFNATGFGTFPLVSSNPCTLVLNVSNCGAGVTSLPVTLDSCQFDTVSKVLNGTLNATPITSVISSAVICTITEISLAANFCSNVDCSQTTVYSFVSNTIFASSVPKLISAAPTVNAITKLSTRVGGASTSLTLTGTNLPRTGDQAAITFALTSIAGGPCDTPITSYSFTGTTGNTMDISYFVSTSNDGCSISLTKITRAGIAATGAGVTTGTNVLRDFVAGNPIISFGSPDSLNRTMDAVIYLNGSNLPVGPAENGIVTLTTSGGDCWMPAPINCAITSYGSTEITCMANLLTLYGDDQANGGCLLNAAVTRLNIVGPSDSTGIRSINWDNLMPPVAAPADPPVEAPMHPPTAVVATPTGSGTVVDTPVQTGTAPSGATNGGTTPTDSSNVGGSSNSGAVIGGAVGGSIAGALVIAGIAVAIVYLMKKSADRPKSLEMESPFELPGGR